MTIEEVSELRKQENKRILRKPNCFKDDLTNDEKLVFQQKFIILNALLRLTKRKGVAQNFLPGSLVNRLIIKKSPIVKSFKGLGTMKKPYKMDCEGVKGRIINAHEFFNRKKYPEFIEKGYCFSNCFTMAYNLAYLKKESKVVSGIFSNGDTSALHSILEVDKYIIDFNLDLAISKDLYYKLFLFEPLNTLSGEQIAKDWEFVEQNIKSLKGMTIMYLVFAYDDVISYINDKERQQQDIIWEK